MVKLFKRKSKEETKDFKFNTSIKIKLPIEEYVHVSYAFQVAILRFERMLKESLLEGYITSTTLEKISQEFNLAEIRSLEIPDTPSLQTIFGSEAAPPPTAKKPVPEVETPTTTPQEIPEIKTPTPRPMAPTTPPITPPTITPTEPSPDAKPTTPSISTEPKTRPTISFSFPESPSEPKEVTPTPTPTTTPQITPPTIPKISFPSKPVKPAAISPLSRSPSRAREEDRATGIAILRKQMLTELKKIRSVVSEQDQ